MVSVRRVVLVSPSQTKQYSDQRGERRSRYDQLPGVSARDDHHAQLCSGEYRQGAC